MEINNTTNDNLNEEFYCLITHEIMKDPVIDLEGNTYEREAIVDWLTHHNTSPMTRTPLRINQLVPNRALKKMIEEELRKLKLNLNSQTINQNNFPEDSKIPSNVDLQRTNSYSNSISNPLSLSLTIKSNENSERVGV